MNENEKLTESTATELTQAIKQLTEEIQHLTCTLEFKNDAKCDSGSHGRK